MYDHFWAGFSKTTAKEHGLMDHKGKTIPREVKSLADRIRKDQPDKDDEYAYRTAWDIYRSYTAEGKQYPHKSPESGLAVAGGGTGSLTKKAFLTEFIAKRRQKRLDEAKVGYEQAKASMNEATAHHPIPAQIYKKWDEQFHRSEHKGHTAGWNYHADKFNDWIKTPDGDRWNTAQAKKSQHR